ncbi:hypothetical protein [Actinomadura bangladeshensis]|uniref:Uncharacterized protein n=1 Tax=Actinomadura bangladeshensis TaxID=453573 RepID=A0A6L9QLJ3_9ACTN|nr:hypothetical protein [Actinomadura bangladeshensis]NEA26389.1 hypothetical protein [Actinomadura bangladeshensis]
MPSGPISRVPGSRCIAVAAGRRTSARSASGTPTSSEMTSVGSRAAFSATRSNSPDSSAASTWRRAITRMRGSSSAIRRG